MGISIILIRNLSIWLYYFLQFLLNIFEAMFFVTYRI